MGYYTSRYMVKCANCHRHGELRCAKLPLAGVSVQIPTLQPAQVAGPAPVTPVPSVTPAAEDPKVPDSREVSVADTKSTFTGFGSISSIDTVAELGTVPGKDTFNIGVPAGETSTAFLPLVMGLPKGSSTSSSSFDKTTIAESLAELSGPPSPAPPASPSASSLSSKSTTASNREQFERLFGAPP